MIYKIVVDKQSRTNPSSEKKEYTIDIEELRVKGDVYDSLVITKDEDYVMRRLSLSELQVLSVLEEPIKQPLPDLNIELFEGDNYIYLLDMTGNKFYAEYIVKNDFTELYVTTNEMNSAINQSASQIELSVNQKLTGYSTTKEMNASINMKADEIISTVSSTYATKNELTTAKSEIKQTTDSITSEVNKTIENIQIGGTNLIKNSAPYNLDKWTSYNGTILSLIDESSAPFGKMVKVSYPNIDSIGVYNYLDEKLEIGKEYSWSVWIKANKEIDMLIGQEQGGTKTIKLTTDWQKITHKFTATDFQFYSFIFYVHGTDQNKEGLEVYIHSVKLEEGNKVTTWSPSPDDTATKVEMNSKIEQTAESINSEVRKKVGNDEIISKINQTAEDITIDANRININGTVSANGNFKVDTQGNMTCNNAKITGGTLKLIGGTLDNPNFDIWSKDKLSFVSAIPGYITCETILGNYANNVDIQANEYQSSFNCNSEKFGTSGRCDNEDGRLTISKYNDDNVYSSISVSDNNSSFWFRRKNNGISGYIDDTKNTNNVCLKVTNGTNSTNIFPTQIDTPNLVQTSLENQKKNFEKLQSGLNIIKNIDIYKYNLKSEDDNTKKHIGFVIGDKYKYSQEVTSNKNDGVDIYSFVAVCCKAIQEQQEQIEQQNNLIQSLIERIENLEKGANNEEN